MPSVDDVQDISPLQQYNAAPAQTVFAYPFPIFEDDNLVVYKDDTLLVLATDYTVAGEGDDTGGDITLIVPCVGGEVITIYRDVPMERLTDFQQNGPRRSADMNDELDRMTMYMQQLKRDLGRKIGLSLRNPQASSELTLDPISSWLERYFFINASGELEPAANIGSTALTQSVIGGLLYPQTAAELSAGVTPVNYAYAPGEVDRYGTNAIPGTTDMTAAFNAAFKVAKTSGTDVVYGRSWPYLVTSAIDVTVDTGADNFGFNVRNIGQAHAVTANAPGYPSILADHAGHVFDCAGAPAINWYDVSVGENSGAAAKSACWFLARHSGGSSQIHRFINCRVNGTFDDAVVYNYGSEEEEYHGCVFVNQSTAAGSKIFWLTANNILGLSSTFITIATGTQSTINHKIFGGSFYSFNTDNTSDVIGVDNCRNIYVYGAFFVCKGRSYLHIDPTNGSSDRIVFHGLEGENASPLNLYGIHMGAGAVNNAQIVIRDSYIPSQTRAVYAGAGVTVSSSTFDNISELASKGIEIVTKLQQSYVNQVSVVVIGESELNTLIGDTSGFTITTRDDDNWHETGATNTTWTPGTAAITHGGTLTVGNLRLSLEGKKMFFSLSLVDTVSMSWAALAAITGLPFSTAIVSADVTVVNYNTGASLGVGFVEGTSIKLPVNAGVGAGVFVIISGSAYVA
jgi:hypothetical protein